MTIRPRDKVALAIVAGVVAIVGFYVLLLSPMRHKASALDAQIGSQRSALVAAQGRYATGRAAQTSLRTHAAAWAALRRAVPDRSDIPELLRVLERNAHAVGVEMQAIQLTGDASSSGAGASTSPSTSGATAASGATTIPLSLTFKGGYRQLDRLVRRLDGLVVFSDGRVKARGPLLSIDNVSLNGSPLTVQMTASIYQLTADASPTTTNGGTS